MKKIKKWLIERVLPVWARAELMAENEQLRREVEDLRIKLRLKDEYIDGLATGIRAQRRIIINTTSEVKK
jgi:hypothetical protein